MNHWDFKEDLFLSSAMIPFAKFNDNIFTTGSPLKLTSGELLMLLGVEVSSRVYAPAFIIINADLEDVAPPAPIIILGMDLENTLPFSVTRFKESELMTY